MAEEVILNGVRITGRDRNTFWNVKCANGCIQSIKSHVSNEDEDIVDGRLLTPSLCHPHIHLDKCFLTSHPKYSDLEIQKGDFAEALKLTTEAKSRFQRDDLLERGRALIQESISFGVTHMRAFVEVDKGVGRRCLEAGLELKKEFEHRCHVQICAFAQDPIFSYDDGGEEMRGLMEAAASTTGVDVVGSTPYVEKSIGNQQKNIEWMIDLALNQKLHLDFHLDYNLDSKLEPMVYHVVQELKSREWGKQRVVTLGHCTRLSLFDGNTWDRLQESIGTLPIHFVGLPTSDLFMMGRPAGPGDCGNRSRGTLNVPQMIKKYGLNCAIGINNVGNAFTPQGSCDCLNIACLGVGVYQAGTKKDAEYLFECVSTRAKAAIGLGTHLTLDIKEGEPANFTVFGRFGGEANEGFRHRTTVQELIHDPGQDRLTIFGGKIVSNTS